MNTKDTNPKDAVGTAKPPISTVPLTVLAEIGTAMMEGARKYRRHNYRVIGVRASIYIDACFRHLAKWWEGEDIDEDSGLSHVTKAIATLVVLRDAMIQSKLNDDRPPKAPAGFFKRLEEQCKTVIAKYPESLPAYTEADTVPTKPKYETTCPCGKLTVDQKCPLPFPEHRARILKIQEDAAKMRGVCPKCGTSAVVGDRHACFPVINPQKNEQRMCAHCGKFWPNNDFCIRCGNCNQCCTEL